MLWVKPMAEPRVTFERVLRHLRSRSFAVLSTAGEASGAHSAGVTYGVSRPGRNLAIYVMTRRHLRKARNIAQDPTVSLVVPLTRRLLWFVPPATIQLQGRAEIVDGTDREGSEVFRRFWLGRRILDAYERSRWRGETRICFLRITPDPVIRTYMVDSSIWRLRTRMESGAATVVIPPEYRLSASPSGPAVWGHGRASPTPLPGHGPHVDRTTSRCCGCARSLLRRGIQNS